MYLCLKICAIVFTVCFVRRVSLFVCSQESLAHVCSSFGKGVQIISYICTYKHVHIKICCAEVIAEFVDAVQYMNK